MISNAVVRDRVASRSWKSWRRTPLASAVFGATALVLGAAGCDLPMVLTPVDRPQAPCSDYEPSSETVRDVEKATAEIREILDETPQCSADETHVNCQLTDFPTSSGDFSWRDADPAAVVMILDGERNCNLIRSPSERRYRYRVAGRYAADQFGNYRPCENSTKLPRALGRIFFETTGAHHFVPAKGFPSDLRSAVHDKFPLAQTWWSHGDQVFLAIAEQVPQATFVLAQPPGAEEDAPFCDATREELESYQKKSAENLKSLISRHGVRFVVFPAGVDRNYVREVYASRCASTPPSEAQINRIYETRGMWERELSSLPGVTFVQAAAYIRPGADLADFAPDCDTVGAPNRVRVAHFDAPFARIGQNGAYQSTPGLDLTIPEAYRGGASCIDMYLNTGLVPPDDTNLLGGAGPFPFESTSSYGIGGFTAPAAGMCSSFVSPMVVSYLLNAVAGGGSSDPATLVSELTADGEKKLHDPLQTESLESYRLKKAWFRSLPRCGSSQ